MILPAMQAPVPNLRFKIVEIKTHCYLMEQRCSTPVNLYEGDFSSYTILDWHPKLSEKPVNLPKHVIPMYVTNATKFGRPIQEE